MNVLDLAAIAARANAATPGPWECTWQEVREDEHGSASFWHHIQVTNDAPHDAAGEMIVYQTDISARRTDFLPDAEFIAHAREDVPALGNEVAALRYAAAHLYERLCDISDEWPGTIAECIPDAPDSARAAALDAWLWYSDRETRP